MDPRLPLTRCLCCGENNLQFTSVLWESLIEEWRLSPQEAEYIDRQQGHHCVSCGNNIRSMALALAIMRCFGFRGLFKDFVKDRNFRSLGVLEINPAGNLSQFLEKLDGHTSCAYPEVDMMSLPYGNESFELVVHSDTLEHISSPVDGLIECFRVLKSGGYCCFTVPIVLDRLTISRKGLPHSYHTSAGQPQTYNLVHTEFGSDVWRVLFESGFEECRIYSAVFPAAQAIAGRKQ